MYYLVYFDKCKEYGINFNLVCIATNEVEAQKMCKEHNANLKELKAQLRALEKEEDIVLKKICNTKEKAIKDTLWKEYERIDNQIEKSNAYKYEYIPYENNTIQQIACYEE